MCLQGKYASSILSVTKVGNVLSIRNVTEENQEKNLI